MHGTSTVDLDGFRVASDHERLLVQKGIPIMCIASDVWTVYVFMIWGCHMPYTVVLLAHPCWCRCGHRSTSCRCCAIRAGRGHSAFKQICNCKYTVLGPNFQEFTPDFLIYTGARNSCLRQYYHDMKPLLAIHV